MKPELAFFQRFARVALGITLDDDKDYLIESRLLPVAKKHGFANLMALARGIEAAGITAAPGGVHATRNAELRRDIVDALVTNESLFFRDERPFQALAETLIPEAMAARQASRELVFWFAACSTGQEAYSVAILIREKFPELLGWKLTLLGTDVSERALGRAREGWYTELEASRGLTDVQRQHHLERDGVGWRITPSIRKMLAFRPHNLMEPPYGIPDADFVFLRHVLIYFQSTEKRAILEHVRTRLRPGGALLVGASETLSGVHEGFRRHSCGRAELYRWEGDSG